MGEPLGERDFVFSGDEKPGLLLRTRCKPTVQPSPGQAGLVEFEYRRHGTATLLALLEIRSGHICHETVAKGGILPFKAIIDKMLEQGQYRQASRIFFIVDNGSSHARERFQARLNEWYPRDEYPEMIAIHTPKHGSWPNQVELFFSIVGRKALRRVECRTRQAMIDHVSKFIERYNKNATPFNWRFTKADLAKKIETWQDPIPN
jgi:transposase